MITLEKIIICHECKGKGQVKGGNLREMHNHDVETCDECRGSGRLKRTVTIKYERV